MAKTKRSKPAASAGDDHAAMRRKNLLVVVLRKAIEEGRKELNDGEYEHLVRVLKKLVNFGNKLATSELDIRPIDGMAVVAEPEIERRVAERHARVWLSLTPEQKEHAQELAELFQNSVDETERSEILSAFLEIIYPEGIAEVGNLHAGVPSDVRGRVDEYHRKVGQEIRRRRRKKGLSQEELAALAGIPQSHVSRLECGKHTPTHITIKKIAKALGTRPKKLDPGFDI